MEKQKKNENACSCDGKKIVKFYCLRCKMYICPDCLVTKHIDHEEEVIDLAEKCTRYLADYQKLSRIASLMADRRQVHIKEESIDNIVNELKGRLVKAKESLQGDITKSTELALKGVEKSPLVQEFMNKKAVLVGKGDEVLSKIRGELVVICKELLKDISENKYESADKRVSEEKLKEYEEEVKKLSKESTKDLEFINEVRKLKQTTIEYSYDPMAVMGMIKVQSAVKKPNRVIQFDREKNSLTIFNVETEKGVSTVINSGFIMPYRFVATEIGGNVYISGGDNDHGVYLKSLYLYDEIRGGLVPMANMQIGRSRHALVSIEEKGLIYAIGGETAEGVTKSCEIYDVKENIWRPGPDMGLERCGLAACAIGGKTIYAIGGWNEEYLKLIETLDIEEGKWEILKISKRHNALKPIQTPAAIPINATTILIFGGYKEEEELTTESYLLDANYGRIEKAKDLQEPEAFISSEVKKIGDKCYAFGYVKGGIHIYNQDSGEWTYTPQDKIF